MLKKALKLIWDHIATIVITGLVAFLFHSFIRLMREDSARCEAHGRKPYTVESVFGVTSDGCTIKKFEKFNADCNPEGFVYVVTKCAAVCWVNPYDKGHKNQCTLEPVNER